MLESIYSKAGKRDKAAKKYSKEEYHRCEMCYGAFSRSVTLPAAILVQPILLLLWN